jgi:basic membrane lipoprotein Med (substrate-binding protein (PBP1-ABC) superfamily)
MYIENKFGGRVKTMAFEGANTDEEVESAIEEAVSKGCNLIFTTAIQMIHQSVRSTIRHPDVKIYNCSIKMSYSSICTYYARMYEAKFLMGAIAAALTKTDRLGYVADYPIYGTVANINAFALGAAMINPNARVQLEWSKVKGQNAREKLRGEGVFIISDDDMITPERASREYGLYIQKDDKTFENLATPIWDWGKFYEQIIRSICRGTAEPGAIKGKKAVNYWWGLSAEVIDVICSGNLPYGTRRLVEFLKESIRTGSLQPFGGVIRAQNGEIRSREGQMLKPDEIITMDWLVENVDGQIPEFEELTEEAQALVQFQGIKIDEADTEE